MAYVDFKDLTRITASDTILRDKVFDIATNPKYDGYQMSPAPVVYTFLTEKASNSCIKNESIWNKELA